MERFVEGREVTVGILDGRSLTPLEIAPKGGFYDYTSKYTKGMTEYILPARISERAASKLRRWSEELAASLELTGVARADYIVDANDRTVFLEVNTIPGMTELSLVPKAAAHEGIGFDELCERIVEGASLKVEA